MIVDHITKNFENTVELNKKYSSQPPYPNIALDNFLPKEKIEVDNGVPVVVDGYEETPVAKWAESLPDWLKKSDPARGSGAPIGRKTSGNLPIGMDKNPFENGGNLTEQMRLYKTNRPLYDQLKAAAKN